MWHCLKMHQRRENRSLQAQTPDGMIEQIAINLILQLSETAEGTSGQAVMQEGPGGSS